MTQEQIHEGNRIIAVFMEGVWKKDENGFSKYPSAIPDWAWRAYDFDKIRPGACDYHESFDWLMPVWIKFRGLSLQNADYEQWVHSLSWYLYSSDTPFRLFDRLVYAIQWYNTQNNQQ